MKNIADRLIQLNKTIRSLETHYQRPQGSVKLLAVSKTWPVSSVQEALVAGQTAFGENYLQEAMEKITALSSDIIEWHFIGPIQSNKTKIIAGHFLWCHGIDRFKIAKRLSEARGSTQTPLNVCVQVNISHEPSKSGVDEHEAIHLCEQITDLPGLKLRGLMTIPEPAVTLSEQRIPFARLRRLQEAINSNGLAMDTLSMGTSHDLEAAIAEGATMVRIGATIFGKRNK